MPEQLYHCMFAASFPGHSLDEDEARREARDFIADALKGHTRDQNPDSSLEAWAYPAFSDGTLVCPALRSEDPLVYVALFHLYGYGDSPKDARKRLEVLLTDIVRSRDGGPIFSEVLTMREAKPATPDEVREITGRALSAPHRPRHKPGA